MDKLQFQTTIDAPAKKVWDVLWDDKTYREWTSVFMEGSCAKSDWEEGSKILFTDGSGDGMSALIHKKIPNKQMSFSHQGEIKNGEYIEGEWKGALEEYFLDEKNGSTDLKVQMDVTDQMRQYFEDVFPKALEKIKTISEQ